MDTSNTVSVASAAAAPPHRNKTVKKSIEDATAQDEHFRNLLDESAREAFNRPWHRLERGLRLNRLRMYVEEVAPQCSFTKEEKDSFFAYLQRALDRKLLNTHKVIQYEPDKQKITLIRGLEVRRMPDGAAKWGFTIKKTKSDGTRRKPRTADAGAGAGAGAGPGAAAAATDKIESTS